MEDTEKTKLEQMLICPVCQDTFKDPRQLPCGHSICMVCLENMMDHTSDFPFRCPDCRTFFGPIIEVQKSYALANIVEHFRVNKRSREEQTKSVYCDCCLEEKTLAIKTCLKCEVSLCKDHLKDHLELPVFTGHPLVRPLGDLLERKCPHHEDKVLRYYCNASMRYICNVCALESKQHNLATEASSVLRRQLTEYMDQRFDMLKEQIGESRDKLQKDIQHKKVKPAVSPLNSVTVVLLFLWFIVLYYAYNYSVENQMLTEALDKQQNLVHHIYSTIAGKPPEELNQLVKSFLFLYKELLVDHPKKSHKPPETEDQGDDLLKHWNGNIS
ncbi:E3 ubiquitin/ISG15 ligase TRIM25-like isoform X2 [Cottoperca gobio]|uniref:E3 ubiquitin/ISG15 ligase TRIM25-like isoform X2 n=1 Tax=Cottoperca gobio TaxID=56716 RepID=A0A6J2RH51_COTGO|nr:E3 ubiquitin/ISG15 ligase TRIM25-like isoform X2 [Cottoperca gobio]